MHLSSSKSCVSATAQSAFTERFILEKEQRQWTVGWVVRCVSNAQTYALQSALRTTQYSELKKIQEKYAQRPFVNILNAFLLWFISLRLTPFTLVTIVIIGNWMSITGDIELTSNSLNYCALKANKMNKSTETRPHSSRGLSVPTNSFLRRSTFEYASLKSHWTRVRFIRIWTVIIDPRGILKSKSDLKLQKHPLQPLPCTHIHVCMYIYVHTRSFKHA